MIKTTHAAWVGIRNPRTGIIHVPDLLDTPMCNGLLRYNDYEAVTVLPWNRDAVCKSCIRIDDGTVIDLATHDQSQLQECTK